MQLDEVTDEAVAGTQRRQRSQRVSDDEGILRVPSRHAREVGRLDLAPEGLRKGIEGKRRGRWGMQFGGCGEGACLVPYGQ